MLSQKYPCPLAPVTVFGACRRPCADIPPFLERVVRVALTFVLLVIKTASKVKTLYSFFRGGVRITGRIIPPSFPPSVLPPPFFKQFLKTLNGI